MSLFLNLCAEHSQNKKHKGLNFPSILPFKKENNFEKLYLKRSVIRDRHMVHVIKNALKKHKRTFAISGAGHPIRLQEKIESLFSCE